MEYVMKNGERSNACGKNTIIYADECPSITETARGLVIASASLVLMCPQSAREALNPKITHRVIGNRLLHQWSRVCFCQEQDAGVGVSDSDSVLDGSLAPSTSEKSHFPPISYYYFLL
jgi:hypothetical protein